MQYIVVESFKGQVNDFYGPFPSQCQAMSYGELKAKQHDNKSDYMYNTVSLITPHIMPEPIHD